MTKLNVPTALTASALPVWQPNTAYPTTQQVAYQNQHYVCVTAHTSGSTFSVGSNWLLLGQLPASVVTGTGPLGYPTNPITDPAAARPNLTVAYWATATQPTNLAVGDVWINNG